MGSEAPSGPSAPRTEVELSDTALICGRWFPPDALAVPVGAAGLAQALDEHSLVPGALIGPDGWLAITVRNRPAASADALRHAVRNGARMDDGYDVLLRIVDIRTELLSRLVERHSEALEPLEETILSGTVPAGRDALGRARLQCARVRRHVLGDRAQFAGLASKHAVQLEPRRLPMNSDSTSQRISASSIR